VPVILLTSFCISLLGEEQNVAIVPKHKEGVQQKGEKAKGQLSGKKKVGQLLKNCDNTAPPEKKEVGRPKTKNCLLLKQTVKI